MNNIRFLLRRVILFAALTAPVVLHSEGAIAQDLESRYEQSLLDSAINYEMLKPRYFTLSKSHEHVLKENVELLMQTRLLSFKIELIERNFAQQQEAEKRKRRRIILVAGVIVVVREIIRQ
jgi:hypothetical protein